MDKMPSIETIISKHNYLTPIPCIFNNDIWEYDIKQANINCLKASGGISDDQYNYLVSVPKEIREVYIGKLQKEDYGIIEQISEGIKISKIQFAIQNNLSESHIIRIANDSIYYNNPYPLENRFVSINNHKLEFVLKNHFTSFLNLNKVILFLNLSNSEEWIIDIKGINSDLHYLHENFLSAICSIIQAKNNSGIGLALNIYNNYYEKYVRRQLPINNYREFNADSCFRIKSKYSEYLYSSQSGLNINTINIDYNLMILRILYSYILTE